MLNAATTTANPSRAGPRPPEGRHRVGHVAEHGVARRRRRAGRQPLEHGRRRVEPPHLDARAAASGTASRPLPTPSSSTRPAGGAAAAIARHGGVGVAGLAVPVVVDVGEAVAVGRRSVAVHPGIVALLHREGW